MEAWIGVDGGMGQEKQDRYRSAEALWAPHTGLLLSTPALSRLMFFPPFWGHTVWHVGILVFHPGMESVLPTVEMQ